MIISCNPVFKFLPITAINAIAGFYIMILLQGFNEQVATCCQFLSCAAQTGLNKSVLVWYFLLKLY